MYPSVQKQMFDILEGWLRHKSDMVNLEAARAICDMKNVTATQLSRSIAGTWNFGYALVSIRSLQSLAALPFISKINTEVCCDAYARFFGADTPY